MLVTFCFSQRHSCRGRGSEKRKKPLVREVLDMLNIFSPLGQDEQQQLVIACRCKSSVPWFVVARLRLLRLCRTKVAAEFLACSIVLLTVSNLVLCIYLYMLFICYCLFVFGIKSVLHSWQFVHLLAAFECMKHHDLSPLVACFQF